MLETSFLCLLQCCEPKKKKKWNTQWSCKCRAIKTIALFVSTVINFINSFQKYFPAFSALRHIIISYFYPFMKHFRYAILQKKWSYDIFKKKINFCKFLNIFTILWYFKQNSRWAKYFYFKFVITLAEFIQREVRFNKNLISANNKKENDSLNVKKKKILQKKLFEEEKLRNNEKKVVKLKKNSDS